jgi:ABC-2 type transport system permease protein
MTNARRGGFWRVLLRELARIGRRPVYPMLMIVLPLASYGILVPLFSASMPRDLPIAVCDRDYSALSRKITLMLDAAPTLHVTKKVMTPQEGQALIRSGEVFALVVFPRRMEKDCYSGLAPKIVGYYNNAYLLAGSLASRDITASIATASAGANIKTRLKKGESTAAAMTHISPIRVDTHTLFNPYTNYAYYLMPSLLPNVVQIFILLSTVFALGSELRRGTAGEWIESAGGSIFCAVTGKLLPYTLTFIGHAAVVSVILFRYVGIPLNGDPHVIAIGWVLMVLAYQSVAILLVSVTANFRMSLSLAALYCSPAFAFTGATFPLEGMPAQGRIWANILPLTHFFNLFIEQAFRGAPIEVSAHKLGTLLIFASVGPVLMLPRLKKIATDSRFWGHV